MIACCHVRGRVRQRRQRRPASEEPAATATADAAATPSPTPASSRSSSCRPTTTRSSRSATVAPEGPADKPWEQMIEPEMRRHRRVQAKKSRGWNLCFSNAAVDNPWRQVGLKTMQAEVEAAQGDRQVHGRRRRGQGRQADLRHRGARSAGNCDALIVVAEHHRHADAGRRGGLREGAGHRLRPRRQHRLPGHVHPPDRRLRLRRRRRRVPEGEGQAGRQDPRPAHPARASTCSRPAGRARRSHLRRGRPRTSSASSSPTATRPRRSRSCRDYIQREGQIDGVWMDAGATAVAAIEAFEDAGQDVPPIIGEDQHDFLTKWKDDEPDRDRPDVLELPVAHRRSSRPLKILKGEEVPKEWVLPQPAITAGEPGPVRRAEHAAAALRAVRLRGPAGLPARAGAASRSMNALGANTWIWVSPLTDERLAELAPRVRAWGFDVRRAADRAARGLGSRARRGGPGRSTGCGASVWWPWRRGASCAATDAGTVASTQAFLRECVDAAAAVGAGAIAGPIYASVGRTWRMTPDERQALLRRAAREPGAGRRARRPSAA